MIKGIKIPLPTKDIAIKLNLSVLGEPTENRVLIIHPNDSEYTTKSGLYVSNPDSNELPKKGVIIKLGPITEGYKTYINQLMVGSIVTYGMYAGKEIEPNFTDSELNLGNDYKYTVLSLNELIYIENQ